MKDLEFQTFLKQVQRRYLLERMLDSLGISLGLERETNYNDLE